MNEAETLREELAEGFLAQPDDAKASLSRAMLGVEPIIIRIERDHRFEKKKGTKHVCGICGEHRLDPNHGPFSYREIDGGQSSWPYRNAKRVWEPLYLKHLARAGMPTNCDCIVVEGRITFPDRIKRDQGNWRFPIEKFLGDALQTGDYINNDTFFPTVAYTFDRFEAIYVKGVMAIELMLMPSA